MKKIWKFPLGSNLAHIIPIKISKGAELLTVGVQQGVFMLWAKVNTSALDVTRHFVIYATGEPLIYEGTAKEGKFICTVFHNGLVWHAYDLGEVE